MAGTDLQAKYEITEIDYWEQDATLVIEGRRVYFQFSKEPTLAEAIDFLVRDSKYYGLGNPSKT